VQITFKYPFILLLFIPIALFLYIYWKKIKSLSRKKDSYFILLLRTSIYSLLVIALAIPQVILPQKTVPVVFLADTSASVDDSSESVLEWIEKSVNGKKAIDEYSVLSFAERTVVEQMMGSDSLRIQQWSDNTGENQTNVEDAIKLASSVLPNDQGGRIILFTDGNETIGNASEALKLLRNRSIELDTVLLTPNKYEDTAVTEIDVPATLYEGEQTDVSITIESNTNKSGILHFYENKEEIISQRININEGTNNIPLSFKVQQSGQVTYKAELELSDDAYGENNKLQVVNMVKTVPTILLVQNSSNEYLVNVLQQSGYKVEVLVSNQLPTVLSGYLNYQSIIFNNIAATDITKKQMNLIEKSVKDFGVGFIMAGGEDSFGLGGYFKTPIEKLLPVDMDIKGKKELPSLGLMIVLDRSGSMEGEKLSLAKEAAARSIELLRETDTLGFIAFDDKPWVVVEPAPLKNKEEVVNKIKSIAPGGGTEIFSSLNEAYEQISDLDVKRKHIILLTDGQSATNSSYEEIIENGRSEDVTLSTVALGADADTRLLEELADLGAGRYYNVQDSSVIPSILSRETVMATRTYIEDDPFYPQIKSGYDWDSLFKDGVPKMNAYIATTPKSEASISMVSTKEDPIYAEWQYGLGRTIAYTSDLNGEWNGDWAAWAKWSNFLTKMVANSLPKYNSEAYSLEVAKENDRSFLSIVADDLSMLPIEATVISEKGEVIDSNTKMLAPGKYEVDINNDPGLYFVNLKKTDENGNISIYQSGFTVPYSTEYLMTGINQDKVEELLASMNGSKLTDEKQAFRPLKEAAKERQEITEILLLFVFFLLFIEIAIRRFGLPRKLADFTVKNPLSKTRQTKNAEKMSPEKKKRDKKKQEKLVTTKNDAPATTDRKKQKVKTDSKELTVKEKVDKENHLEQLLEMKRKKKR